MRRLKSVDFPTLGLSIITKVVNVIGFVNCDRLVTLPNAAMMCDKDASEFIAIFI